MLLSQILGSPKWSCEILNVYSFIRIQLTSEISKAKRFNIRSCWVNPESYIVLGSRTLKRCPTRLKKVCVVTAELDQEGFLQPNETGLPRWVGYITLGQGACARSWIRRTLPRQQWPAFFRSWAWMSVACGGGVHLSRHVVNVMRKVGSCWDQDINAFLPRKRHLLSVL
jgi:hypothetical protein